MSSIRIGIDIGGTFTDFVVYDQDTRRLETFKLISTPKNPAQAVLNGLRRIDALKKSSEIEIIHGSTVATNALLERKGARTALVTTRGFRDVLQIGRQNRPALYDLSFEMPPPLVPETMRLEVDERVQHNGLVQKALDPSDVEAVLSHLSAFHPDSVAVCLLFSFLYPAHEQMLADRLREQGYFVSLSSEILPEYREYERTATTVVNAYVSPVLDKYLRYLESGLVGIAEHSTRRLRVMQSNGGAISPGEARRKGVQCILSGPAGGIIGSQFIAQVANRSSAPSLEGTLRETAKLITFDMGGTSTDVSLIDGSPRITTEASIGDLPVRIPLLDIHTIGAGGGSIAHIDLGGSLRVGPESAGADPGPACYGKGDLPTVTDANLVLGRLAPDQFLGGELPLDVGRAHLAMETLGKSLGIDVHQTALGIIEVANAHMERALRVISVERGFDPREFTLISFGGAGGLHACELAQRLGMRRVLVPPYASVLSALGMLAADVIKDYSLTVMLPGSSPAERIEAALQPLIQRGLEELNNEGMPPEQIRVETFLDMRYAGQSYELTIPYTRNFAQAFHAAHRHEYGYSRTEVATEIVNLRVRVIGVISPLPLKASPASGSDGVHAQIDRREVIFQDRRRRIPIYQGEKLLPGDHILGPAGVVRKDTTVLLLPGVSGTIDGFGNLHLDILNDE